MWETHDLDVTRYRCHVGHAFTEDVLAHAQEDAVEQALWAAVRALEEKAELLRRMASRARDAGRAAAAARYEESANDTERQATTVYCMLTGSEDGADSQRAGRKPGG